MTLERLDQLPEKRRHNDTGPTPEKWRQNNDTGPITGPIITGETAICSMHDVVLLSPVSMNK